MDDEDSPEARARRRLARLMVKPPPIAIQVKLIERLAETLGERLESLTLQAKDMAASSDAVRERQEHLTRVQEGLEEALNLLESIPER